MNFRFERTRTFHQKVHANLSCYRSEKWEICGVFAVRPGEYEELARIFRSGGVEVILSDATESLPAHGSEGPEAPRG
jgi:hypothetical protein